MAATQTCLRMWSWPRERFRVDHDRLAILPQRAGGGWAARPATDTR